MALLDILKKAKKKVDDAIPDFNIRQKAEQAVKQVGRTISNVERVSQQAGSQARRQVNRAAPVVTSFVKEAPKQFIAGTLAGGSVLADTGLKGLQKAEDIVTAPLGKGYKERLQNLRSRQSATEDRILQGLKPLEQKKGQGLQNYLKDAYNIALPTVKSAKQATPLQRGAATLDAALNIATFGAGAPVKELGKQGLKQIAKQYGKTALLQGAGGAAGTATMKDATASDIAKGALAGAVFGTGLKGAGDVTRVATPAITRQISKAGQKVQTAFEQPKFQPGFASTKPKAGIEPKQFSTIISPYQKQLQENANKDFQASKTFKFKHNVNDKVKFKFGDGSIKNAIITDYYLENGIPQYTVRVPSSNNRRIKLKEQEVINRKQPKTEAPVVKLAKTEAKQVPQRAIEKAETIFGNLQDKKAGRNIPGFTPAPEVKAPQATRIQVGDLKVKSQVQPTENIVVKSKNVSVPSLTEADVNQIARNTKRTPQEVVDSYGALSNRISETSKKPVSNIQASLTSFIRDPKKWDNQFVTPQKVLTSEELGAPKVEISQPEVKRPQVETDKVIREKVFKKEPEIKKPVIKLKTEVNPEKLARQAVEKATKQPISPEMPSVARVSQKADTSVSPEVKINDRFPIKTTVDSKQKIDYDKLIDFGTKISDEKSKNALLNRIGLEAERIGAEYTKRTKKGFDSFVDELESGNLDNKAVDLYDEVSNLFNVGNKISTVRNNQITGNITNYFRRIKKEGLEKILTEGSQKNLGDILYTPGFAKKRTGALVDYEKTPAVIKAYFDEAIGPISKEQNALVKTANQIKNQVNKSEIVDKDGVIKPTSSIKYVQTIKDNVEATAQNKYNDVKKAIIPGVRSVKNRVFQLADKKFYDDFLKPFNNAQRDYNNALQNASKLSNADVKNLAQSLGIKVSDKANKDQLLLRIAGEYKKQYYGPATETFMKNVANADIKEPNGLQLLEDIAETYIGSEVRKNKFIDKLSGEIRLGYARGALGLNVGSAINNVLELKKVLSRAGIKNTAGAIKDYMAGVDLRNKYGVATTSNIFQDEAFNLLKKVDPVLFSLFDFSENAKNRLFLSSLEKLGKNKGLQGDDLEYFVLKNFEQYGLAGGRAEDIGLFTGGKRPLTKTAFQFLQYPIKDTVAFADALSNGLKKAVKDKKLNEDLSYAMVYGLTSVAQMAILSQIIGQKGFGSQTGFTPFDFLKQISSGDVTGPGTDAIIKLGTWVNEIMQPESDKKEENVRKAQTDMNRTFLMGVVPAYNQIWNRTGRYIQDRNRGYFETGSGNVANLVTDDVWGKIRAIILGRSYDPERQKYFIESQKSKSPNLGKQESAVFKEIKKRSGLDKAKEFFSSIMNKRETDKAIKKLEEGVGIDKPKGMSDEEWLETQATNEVLIQSGLVSNDTLADYYSRNIQFGKSVSERTINETKVFNLVNSLESDEKFKKLSDEQKKDVSNKLLERAGIPRDVVDYYNKANNSVVVKYQMALEEIEENKAKDPNFNVLDYLAQGRRKINTKVFASQNVLKLLEQDGIITESQYKVLNKQNYLYLDGEFKNRNVAVKLKGSGKGGKGGKNSGKKDKVVKLKNPSKSSRKYMTLSSLMAGETRLKDVPKIKANLRLIDLKNQPKPTILQLKRTLPKPVLRLKARQNAGIKPLTTQKIKVKYR